MTTSGDVNDNSNRDDNDAKNKDGGNGDNNDGEVEHAGGDDDDNDDKGTMTMRWQQGRLDDDNAMAMDGKGHAECLLNARERCPTHPRQQSTYVNSNSLGRSQCTDTIE